MGAGIIALPVKTFGAGFGPSSAVLCLAFAYMTAAALLLVELSAAKPGANLSAMALEALGGKGRGLCVGLYYLIYLATLTAYVAESGHFLAALLRENLDFAVPARSSAGSSRHGCRWSSAPARKRRRPSTARACSSP